MLLDIRKAIENMSTELKMEQKRMKAAPLGEGCSVPDLSGEDIWQNQLQFCLDEEEVYGGYGVIKSAYPYRQQNDYTRELQDREVQTIILENRYLKAVFLPEYGGRLWELWDKETGKSVIYKRCDPFQQPGGKKCMVQRRRGVECRRNGTFSVYRTADICCQN